MLLLLSIYILLKLNTSRAVHDFCFFFVVISILILCCWACNSDPPKLCNPKLAMPCHFLEIFLILLFAIFKQLSITSEEPILYLVVLNPFSGWPSQQVAFIMVHEPLLQMFYILSSRLIPVWNLLSAHHTKRPTLKRFIMGPFVETVPFWPNVLDSCCTPVQMGWYKL